MKKLFLVTAVILLSGCGPGLVIDKAIGQYNYAESRVELGDSKSQVLAILSPSQAALSSKSKKRSDKYMKDNVLVEIYYFRTGRQPDGLTTDDEFTPYVFNNGKLVAVGWASIGGPKTQGQTQDSITVNNSTVVY